MFPVGIGKTSFDSEFSLENTRRAHFEKLCACLLVRSSVRRVYCRTAAKTHPGPFYHSQIFFAHLSVHLCKNSHTATQDLKPWPPFARTPEGERWPVMSVRCLSQGGRKRLLRQD